MRKPKPKIRLARLTDAEAAMLKDLSRELTRPMGKLRKESDGSLWAEAEKLAAWRASLQTLGGIDGS